MHYDACRLTARASEIHPGLLEILEIARSYIVGNPARPAAGDCSFRFELHRDNGQFWWAVDGDGNEGCSFRAATLERASD
jgi:hypothetical protein